MQGETEGAMKISASRASKRAPTWHSCTITPKSLSGQPLDRLIQTQSRGWPERDFGVVVQLYHVGARFEALDAMIFMASSVLPCIFFMFLDFPLEQCGLTCLHILNLITLHYCYPGIIPSWNYTILDFNSLGYWPPWNYTTLQIDTLEIFYLGILLPCKFTTLQIGTLEIFYLGMVPSWKVTILENSSWNPWLAILSLGKVI